MYFNIYIFFLYKLSQTKIDRERCSNYISCVFHCCQGNVEIDKNTNDVPTVLLTVFVFKFYWKTFENLNMFFSNNVPPAKRSFEVQYKQFCVFLLIENVYSKEKKIRTPTLGIEFREMIQVIYHRLVISLLLRAWKHCSICLTSKAFSRKTHSSSGDQPRRDLEDVQRSHGRTGWNET